jgi:ATP-dependent exoDNAse (exonuclease V) beta subunit
VRNPYFDDSGEKIKLLNITESLSVFSPTAREIYEREKLNSLLEELNVLYVSMTRSKYEFYGIVPPKAKQSNNLIPQLFTGETFLLGSKQKYAISDNLEENLILDSYSSSGYTDMYKYFTVPKKDVFDITEARKKGAIIHYALSTIITVKDKSINDVIKEAMFFSERRFPFENVGFIKENLKNLFSSKEILEMFSYEKDEIFNEKEIVNSSGESFRIDKLIVSRDKFIILDFKSSSYDEEENKKQLENYVFLVSEIYPYKKALAYIVDIDKNLLVKVCQE